MRKTNRKDRSKKSRNDVVAKLLELDDLKKVTGGSDHNDPPKCRGIGCQTCFTGNRGGKG